MTESCHVVVVAKLLLSEKVGESNGIGNGVLVLNCVDLTSNDYAVVIKNYGSDGSIDLCVGNVTVYKTKSKCVLVVSNRRNVVRIGLATLTYTVNKVMGVRGNVVGIGLTALTFTVYKVVGVRGNIVGVGLAALTLAVNKVVGVIVAATKGKYEYKYDNKYCGYCADDNAKSLLIKRLLSCGLIVNRSLLGLVVEILHFFAHFYFSPFNIVGFKTPSVIIT